MAREITEETLCKNGERFVLGLDFERDGKLRDVTP